MPTLLIIGALAVVGLLALSRTARAREGRNMPPELEFALKQSVVQASATGNALLLGQTGQMLITRGFAESGNRLIRLGAALQSQTDQIKAMLSGATVNDAANVERGQRPQFLPAFAEQVASASEELATLANLTAIYLVEAGAAAGSFVNPQQQAA